MNAERNRVVIFLGPPGAGKGTQAERLARDLDLVKISTGDILRDHVARGTELGLQVKDVLDKGQLVSDDILIALIRDKLASLEAVRVIFDGFPRTVAQAHDLDVLLEELGAPIHAVPLLEVPDEELIERIVERGKTSGRSDDTAEVARQRQAVYREQTQPLIEYYRARGHLRVIDGVGSMDDVYGRLRNALN
ncbi:adenylate kinase [Deinococcus maricopensis]|uniref:Adenylate kinase n=1 Tax=Deinococcus maricopensis (strain DSM 21211 / LMG 22137 / NRRL B-23946 / LB-34) TaxID=709986 RepID=E8UBV9_DEIML|nr:adenylate kinase [Deinococcus maricopensis]ADV68548.1 Adenylate kinase [Deinococcus maricopensis DSM 21211]